MSRELLARSSEFGSELLEGRHLIATQPFSPPAHLQLSQLLALVSRAQGGLTLGSGRG
jgi:hypothetical protein